MFCATAHYSQEAGYFALIDLNTAYAKLPAAGRYWALVLIPPEAGQSACQHKAIARGILRRREKSLREQGFAVASVYEAARGIKDEQAAGMSPFTWLRSRARAKNQS